jgi:hypothetical protein
MGVKLGECVLHLSEHYGDGCPGAALRIPVNHVTEYMAQLRSKQFGNSRPGEPQETPWGTSEITIADPASNRLTFFTANGEESAATSRERMLSTHSCH